MTTDSTARALCYDLVVAPMLRLPDEEFVACLRSRRFAESLDEVGRCFGSPRMTRGLALVREYVNGLGLPDGSAAEACGASDDECGRGASAGELRRDRTYLFRALRPGVGAPPAYESHWRTPGSSGAVMSRLVETYRDAGIEVSPGAHERPDYLGVELAFLMRLVSAEAQATQAERRRLLGEEATFFFGHVEPWASRFLDEALPVARTAFYRGVLEMALALVEAESGYLTPYRDETRAA